MLCNSLMPVFLLLLQMNIGSKYRLSASLTTNNQYRPWKNHIDLSLFRTQRTLVITQYTLVVVNSFYGLRLLWVTSLESVLLTTTIDNDNNDNNHHHHSMCIKYISHITNTSMFNHLFIAVFNLLLRFIYWSEVSEPNHLSPQCFWWDHKLESVNWFNWILWVHDISSESANSPCTSLPEDSIRVNGDLGLMIPDSVEKIRIINIGDSGADHL